MLHVDRSFCLFIWNLFSEGIMDGKRKILFCSILAEIRALHSLNPTADTAKKF